jgi:hypothetical protein
VLKAMLWSALFSWTKLQERRRRLKRAPELILRAHLLMKDKEIRTLKRHLFEERERSAALEVQLYQQRLANEELVWARCKRVGLERFQEEPTMAQAAAVREIVSA